MSDTSRQRLIQRERSMRERAAIGLLRVFSDGIELFKATSGGLLPAGLPLESASIELLLLGPRASQQERQTKGVVDITICRNDDPGLTPTVRVVINGVMRTFTWDGEQL